MPARITSSEGRGALRHLDSAIIAWALYSGTRLADVMTTGYLLEVHGRDPSWELHAVPRLFMVYYGVHRGNVLHEISVLALTILLYILVRVARRNLDSMRLVTPKLVPYTVAFVSVFIVVNNLIACFH